MPRRGGSLRKLLQAVIVLNILSLATASLPLIPGASTLLSGFNIVEGTSSYSPIFQWTFAKNNTWANPQYWNLIYQVPDQITVTNEPFTEQTSYASVFDSVTSNQQYQALSYGIGIKDFKMGMSAESKVSSDVRQTFYNRRFAASTRLKTGVYAQVLVGNVRQYLDPYFVQVFSKLPASISTQAEKDEYLAFLLRFGTHFSGNILFGGMIQMTTQLDYSLSSSFSKTELQQQLNTQFSLLAGNITNTNQNNQLSTEFAENSVSSIFLVGGNTSDLNPAQWGEWIHTVYFDPVPIDSSLLQISALAPDPIIGSNINAMIDEYLYSSALAWCDADMCNGHGRCTSAGTDNPFQECDCTAGITGANCTESVQIEQELISIGPAGSYNCTGTSPTSFALFAAPGDYITTIGINCYSSTYIQSMSITFNNGTSYSTNTKLTSKITTVNVPFSASDPVNAVSVGSFHNCVNIGTSTMSVAQLQFTTQSGSQNSACGTSSSTMGIQIPPSYRIVGIMGTTWDSQIASLGFYYREN